MTSLRRQSWAKKKAASDKIMATNSGEKGLIIVHTGAGKGKSSSAFGMIVRCVAHGVRDFTNKVVGAIGVSGPIWRLTLQALGELSQKVANAAERLSAELGQNPPTATTPTRKRGR